MDISVRQASIADLNDISALAKDLEPELKGLMSTEQIDYLQDLNYSQGSLLNSLEEGQVFFIAQREGQSAGFASYIKEGDDLYHLTKIYVDEPFRHQGAGTRLFESVVNHIKSVNKGPCVLELNINNHNLAYSFYVKLGFKKVRDLGTDMGRGFYFTQDVLAIDL